MQCLALVCCGFVYFQFILWDNIIVKSGLKTSRLNQWVRNWNLTFSVSINKPRLNCFLSVLIISEFLYFMLTVPRRSTLLTAQRMIASAQPVSTTGTSVHYTRIACFSQNNLSYDWLLQTPAKALQLLGVSPKLFYDHWNTDVVSTQNFIFRVKCDRLSRSWIKPPVWLYYNIKMRESDTAELNERIAEFRSDPEKLRQATEFVDEIIQQAKKEAELKQKEKEKGKFVSINVY